MAEAAVAENPAETTETEGVQATETEGLEQTAPATDGADTPQTDAEPDAILAAIKDGDAADLEALIDQRAEEKLQKQQEQKRAEKLRTQRKEKVAATVSKIGKAYDVEGELLQPVWDALNALGLDLDEITDGVVREEYAEAMLAKVPEADRDVFLKDVDGKGIDAWIDGIAERRALETKAVKSAKPEDLLKANAALRRAFEKHGEEREKAGRELGRNDPAGETRADERSATTTRSVAWLNALPIEEYEKIPVEERRRIWAGG